MKNSKFAVALIAGVVSVALCAPAAFAAKSHGNSSLFGSHSSSAEDKVETKEKASKIEDKRSSGHKKAVMHKKHSSKHGKKHHNSH